MEIIVGKEYVFQYRVKSENDSESEEILKINSGCKCTVLDDLGESMYGHRYEVESITGSQFDAFAEELDELQEKPLSETAYEKYRLYWMLTHGYTIVDLINSLEAYREEDPEETIPALLETWEQDSGFDGSLWSCYEEFLECEFQNKEYMRKLLSKDEYKAYMKWYTAEKSHI